MGIRGDAEAKYWAEMGREKPREMLLWFIDCLADPNLWQRMQRELELTDTETSAFLHCVNWIRDELPTRPAQLNDKASAHENNNLA